MKKVVLLLCAVLLLTGCNTNSDDDINSELGISIKFPKTGNYFCPEENYDGTYVTNEDIFDAGEKCEAWNSDFWKETAPSAYNDCLKRKKLFAERFQLGTCTPILKKTHNIGKSGCLYEIAMEYKKILKYSCFGADIPRVIKEIKEKYEIQDF